MEYLKIKRGSGQHLGDRRSGGVQNQSQLHTELQASLGNLMRLAASIRNRGSDGVCPTYVLLWVQCPGLGMSVRSELYLLVRADPAVGKFSKGAVASLKFLLATVLQESAYLLSEESHGQVFIQGSTPLASQDAV